MSPPGTPACLPATTSWSLRLANAADIEQLQLLIPLSVRTLQAGYYSKKQMDAALGPVFGVDRQLIADGTYFVAEAGGRIAGCGGWSRRSAVYGGDCGRVQDDPPLDPRRDPARVRAFFVHPDFARKGIGRALLRACEQAISEAGFSRVILVATLAGEPLYAAHGYAVEDRYDAPIPGGLSLPVVRMAKVLAPSGDAVSSPLESAS